MVPGSFGCASVVLAAITTLAPSRAARSAIARPMPREPPVMKSVLPLRSAIAVSSPGAAEEASGFRGESEAPTSPCPLRPEGAERVLGETQLLRLDLQLLHEALGAV